jgi:NAD(P)-dependent dehydrogenase (short-subunit alcohol dehydrogenase family)
MSMFDLSGRVALVTGGNGGIGLGLARGLARCGAAVMVAGRDAGKNAAAVEELSSIGAAKADSVVADITDEAAVAAMVDATASRLGGLDILVNNAARQQARPSLDAILSEDFDATLKTNLYAMFWITKAALPHLKPGSTIINTTSIQAYDPSPGLVDYASTKATINAFTKALAQQLAPKGIRVNAVAPGPIWTPLQPSDGQPQEKIETFGEQTPIGRAGQPAELAPAYVFLASAESSYVAGETLAVTGGSPTP